MATKINLSATVFCEHWDEALVQHCGLECKSRKVYREHALKEHASGLVRGSNRLFPLRPDSVQQRVQNIQRHQRSGPSRTRRKERRALEGQEAEQLRREAEAHPGRRWEQLPTRVPVTQPSARGLYQPAR